MVPRADRAACFRSGSVAVLHAHQKKKARSGDRVRRPPLVCVAGAQCVLVDLLQLVKLDGAAIDDDGSKHAATEVGVDRLGVPGDVASETVLSGRERLRLACARRARNHQLRVVRLWPPSDLVSAQRNAPNAVRHAYAAEESLGVVRLGAKLPAKAAGLRQVQLAGEGLEVLGHLGRLLVPHRPA